MKPMSLVVSINKSCTLLYLCLFIFCVERRADRWRRNTIHIYYLVTSLAGLKSAVLVPATVATVAGTNTADLRPANQPMIIVQLQYTSTQNSTNIEPL